MIYFIQNTETAAIKIGLSVDPAKRLASLQTASADPLKLLGTIEGGRDKESALHCQFSAHRLSGEWFRGHPELVEAVCEIIQTARGIKPYRTTVDKAMDATGFYGSDSEGMMLCPCCGFEYQHAGSPSRIDGKDDYAAGWGGRGDLVIVPFWGECGSEWDICFGFHKGYTANFVRVRKDCRNQIDAITCEGEFAPAGES